MYPNGNIWKIHKGVENQDLTMERWAHRLHVIYRKLCKRSKKSKSWHGVLLWILVVTKKSSFFFEKHASRDDLMFYEL